MRKEFLEFLSRKAGIRIAKETLHRYNYPTDYRKIEEIEREVYDIIDHSVYSQAEKEYMREGIKDFFVNYKLNAKDCFIDVI